MSWYAIYTKPRWEKKVHALLLKKGIESYCPLNRVVKQWSDRKKKVEIPLFTSYIFTNITVEQYSDIRMTAGVVNFVYWLGKPAIISNTEMKALQDFVDNNENILVQQIGYKEGDSIAIESGIFKGQKATVNKVNKNKVELILEELQIKLVVGI
jgi:transcription antitermination factor NusG